MIKKGNSKPYVISFENVGMNDVDIVGGKNASLGEMISKLTTKNIRVPNGFATTAQAFKDFIEYNQLTNKIQHKLSALDVNDIDMLTSVGSEIRKWICDAKFHKKFEQEIKTAFSCLENQSNESFAVRSSATAEDLPQASFAGQQETYLNICGIDNIFKSILLVFASLYNDRAISYRVHQGFDHSEVAISAGIQKMVREYGNDITHR